MLKDLSEKTIILGVIDLSDEEVEPAELVADRVRRAFPFTSPDRITIATDYGISTSHARALRKDARHGRGRGDPAR